MYMYYIVYCQEIAHYNLKNPKKIKNMAALYKKHMLGVVSLSAPEIEIPRSLSLMAV